jgi:hypothetical protein
MNQLTEKLSLIAVIGVLRQFARLWLTGWVLNLILVVILLIGIIGRVYIKHHCTLASSLNHIASKSCKSKMLNISKQ